MHLSRLDEDPKIFAGVFTIAYEFGQFFARNLNVISHIIENYECIVSVDAIKTLASF
jgi:adapter protein MecA 1/2